MNKKSTLILIVIFVMFMVIAAYAYNSLSDKAEISPSVTDKTEEIENSEKIKAPDFTMLDSSGKELKLSDLFGKPIVLNFWASWCSPCKREMPEFDRVYKEMGDEIIFMMVDMVDAQRETKEKGEKYINQQGFSFPVYFDAKQEGAYIYGIQSIPSTLFIDKDGYVLTGVQGAIDEKTLRSYIELIK